MGRITHDHFCLLIFGQGLWKENFIKKMSKETKYSYFHLAGYSKDSEFCKCLICRASIQLFDPQNPGYYVYVCDICKALFEKFKKIQGQNEGIILFSHHLIYDLSNLQDLTQNLLSNERIKKIYLLQVESVYISKPIPEIIEKISHRRLNKSEFSDLLKMEKFENSIIYEIFKDKYY